jgi:hypothetical protein
MLSRSKDTPLVIRIIRARGTVPSQTVLAVKLALQHSERIKNLSLFINLDQWEDLQTALPKSAPQLEHLSLFSSTYSFGPTLNLFDPKEILSETPKLRHLDLSDFDFNWDTHSHLLHGLTCLKLHSVFVSYITWRQFSDALEGMPNLQILHLYNALPAAVNERISWPPIHLASLQTMFVHSEPKIIETLFTCITFPSTTKVRIECDILPVAKADLPILGTRLARFYSNMLLDMYFQTLILRGPDHSKVELRLFTDALTEEQMLAHHEISAPLEFIFTQISTNAKRFTKAINDVFTGGLSLQNISRVYLSGIIYPFRPESLANTIGKLSQLRFLVAKRDAGRFLFNALQLESNQALPSGPLYFPNLSSVYFLGSWFMGSTQHPYHIPVESLRNWLTRRSKFGAGLAKLKFELCHSLYREDIDLLREAVEDLEWDEEEVSADVDEDEDRSENLAYWHERQLLDDDKDENEVEA